MDDRLHNSKLRANDDPSQATAYLSNLVRSGSPLIAKFLDPQDLTSENWCSEECRTSTGPDTFTHQPHETNFFKIIAPLDTIPYSPGISLMELTNKVWLDETAKIAFGEPNFFNSGRRPPPPQDFEMLAGSNISPEIVFYQGIPDKWWINLLPPYQQYLLNCGMNLNHFCTMVDTAEQQPDEIFIGFLACAAIVTRQSYDLIEHGFRAIQSHYGAPPYNGVPGTPFQEHELEAIKRYRNILYLQHAVAFLDNGGLQLAPPVT